MEGLLWWLFICGVGAIGGGDDLVETETEGIIDNSLQDGVGDGLSPVDNV